MTQLQLIQIDPTPVGYGSPEKKTVLAVSSSWSALRDYCIENYGQTPNDNPDSIWDVRYKIEKSNIVIVRDNASRFDK